MGEMEKEYFTVRKLPTMEDEMEDYISRKKIMALHGITKN